MVRVKPRTSICFAPNTREESDHWSEEAACLGMDTDLFFTPETRAEALKICNGCPVKDLCLKSNKGVEYGVFGGTTAAYRGHQGWVAKDRHDRVYMRVTGDIEAEAAALRIAGKTNPEIMEELGITKSSLSRIMRKLGLLKDQLEASKSGGAARRGRPNNGASETRLQIEAALLTPGKTVKQIAEDFSKTISYVYNVRRDLAEKGKLTPLQVGKMKYDYNAITLQREEGMTWTEIGKLYGRSNESVSQSYRNWLADTREVEDPDA